MSRLTTTSYDIKVGQALQVNFTSDGRLAAYGPGRIGRHVYSL